ncbi:hypothetical protein HSACCH_00174 [Halanaerobium saccharolyticum subsp. saccharolyticum DSM 6643]|uniref:Uncharacterized protein n=1 Tax=Halanaerobium saccharolyticum subsp. saccharolyticum DSM 6643 TaxID=1293054 RepID=M5DXZ8_9FIRM|nr:DUF6691 family protein [Halanaerobium saccharolyticum]CCU77801.1 hypothetical protein HSACCH_00174 [Halanaerobium saccharolyticum subsp. saccharolyticum DSM 6643]
MESKTRLLKGLGTGIIFGFLLQRGGVTDYNVLVGQLLLEDFTVAKIILTAIVVGMVGVHFLSDRDIIKLKPKSGSLKRTLSGGLIFGVGFALLGYCPGTIAGAIGQGSIDALIPGLLGIFTGSFLFAAFYEKFSNSIDKDKFKVDTLPELFKVNHWKVIIPLSTVIIIFLVWLEVIGF